LKKKVKQGMLNPDDVALFCVQGAKPRRAKVEQMSSEVVDSNPYSRLMALKRMGIVDNYENIRDLR
jgi:ubiquitin-like modifier-activating enzyme 5